MINILLIIFIEFVGYGLCNYIKNHIFSYHISVIDYCVILIKVTIRIMIFWENPIRINIYHIINSYQVRYYKIIIKFLRIFYNYFERVNIKYFIIYLGKLI